jgi:class 3 adenylate cyclase
MSWQAERARTRINELMESVPEVLSERFEGAYLQRFFVEQQEAVAKGMPTSKPLVNLQKNRAVIVDGVHVYATLVNYDEYRLEEGLETEESHARALNFLHLHYAACDRVIERHGAQRVDFHGSRVHLVVVEPSGEEYAKERVLKALNLAEEIQLLSKMANEEIAEGKYPAAFRIGIDAGVCTAINGGKSREHEPLFLGKPANYAAKLAEGAVPGIYISGNVRSLIELQTIGSFDRERQTALNEVTLQAVNSRFSKLYTRTSQGQTRELLNEWQAEIHKHHVTTGGASKFKFYYHKPPLVTIDYDNLSPGNSIRMHLASIFADVDGYTKYIDQAVASGNVGEAVRALHVIRGELNNVLQKDFKGRKVRFVGDCIHGLLADGDASSTDNPASVMAAVRCAAAMRSSFQLCQELLPAIKDLGLAIGIELGATPISRIGIRGERSVRLASSIATAQSEAIQKECAGNQTGIGSTAYDAASLDIQRLFGNNFIADDFAFPDTIMIPGEIKSAIGGYPTFRAHACEV